MKINHELCWRCHDRCVKKYDVWMLKCPQYSDHRQSFSPRSNSKIIYTWISSTNGMHVYLQNVITAPCLPLHVWCSNGDSHSMSYSSFRIYCISYLEKPNNSPLPLHPLNVSSLNYNVGVTLSHRIAWGAWCRVLWLEGQQHLTITIYTWRH